MTRLVAASTSATTPSASRFVAGAAAKAGASPYAMPIGIKWDSVTTTIAATPRTGAKTMIGPASRSVK